MSLFWGAMGGLAAAGTDYASRIIQTQQDLQKAAVLDKQQTDRYNRERADNLADATTKRQWDIEDTKAAEQRANDRFDKSLAAKQAENEIAVGNKMTDDQIAHNWRVQDMDHEYELRAKYATKGGDNTAVKTALDVIKQQDEIIRSDATTPDERDAAKAIRSQYQSVIDSSVFGEGVPQTSSQGIKLDLRPTTIQKVNSYAGSIERAAAVTKLPPALIKAVIHPESGGNPNAVSPAGAVGAMQLMPKTAKDIGLTVSDGVDDRLDPNKNIAGGSKYLAQMINDTGDLKLGIAAYNAGPGTVRAAQAEAKKHGKGSSYEEIAPYLPKQETRDYVPKVLAYFQHYSKDEQLTRGEEKKLYKWNVGDDSPTTEGLDNVELAKTLKSSRGISLERAQALTNGATVIAKGVVKLTDGSEWRSPEVLAMMQTVEDSNRARDNAEASNEKKIQAENTAKPPSTFDRAVTWATTPTDRVKAAETAQAERDARITFAKNTVNKIKNWATDDNARAQRAKMLRAGLQ